MLCQCPLYWFLKTGQYAWLTFNPTRKSVFQPNLLKGTREAKLYGIWVVRPRMGSLLQDRTSGCDSESVFKLKHFHKGRCWIARWLKMREKANEEMVQLRSVTDLVSQAPSSSVSPETQVDFYRDHLKVVEEEFEITRWAPSLKSIIMINSSWSWQLWIQLKPSKYQILNSQHKSDFCQCWQTIFWKPFNIAFD